MMLRALATALVVSTCLLASAFNPADPFHQTEHTRFQAVIERHQIQQNLFVHLTHERTNAKINERCDHRDSKSLYLPHRRCFPMRFNFHAEGNTLNQVSLDFGIHASGTPAFVVSVYDHATYDQTKGTSNTPLLQTPRLKPKENAQHMNVPWPADHTAIESLPAVMLFVVDFEPQVITTYTYSFPDGLSTEIRASGESYDLTPHNNSMGMRFMVRVRDGKLSVWVHRKPPMTPFLLSVVEHEPAPVDDEERDDATPDKEKHNYATEVIFPNPHSSEAFGFDVDLLDGSLAKGQIDFVAHFFEDHRSHFAVAEVKNLRSLIRDLVKETEVQGRKQSQRIIDTDKKDCKLRVFHHRHTSFIGVHLLQPFPLENLMMSIFRTHPEDADRENRFLLLREIDAVVPYYPRDNLVQYGWFDAIPSNESNMRDDANVDQLDGPVIFEFNFDAVEHLQEEGSRLVKADSPSARGRLLKRWVRYYGGEVSNIDLDAVFAPSGVAGITAPAVMHAVAKGKSVATLPYDSVLPYSRIESSPWVKIIQAQQQPHTKHVEEHQMHPEADRFLHFTAVILGHLLEETMNFRVEFDTFFQEPAYIPYFYSAEELALFSFEPAVEREVTRMRRLWQVEYELLASLGREGYLPHVFTRADFDRVRANVETRLLNLSSVLSLTPVMDLLPHDSDPAVVAQFNDEAQKIELIAQRDLGGDEAGRRLTMDHGANEKTDVEFLVQYGRLPQSGRASTVLPFVIKDVVYHLTDDEESRRAILADLEGGRTDFCAQIRRRLAQLPTALPPKSKAVKLEVYRAAEALVTMQRVALNQQSTWCSTAL